MRRIVSYKDKYNTPAKYEVSVIDTRIYMKEANGGVATASLSIPFKDNLAILSGDYLFDYTPDIILPNKLKERMEEKSDENFTAYGYYSMSDKGELISILSKGRKDRRAYIIRRDGREVLVNDYIKDRYELDSNIINSEEFDRLKITSILFSHSGEEMISALMKYHNMLVKHGILKIRVVDILCHVYIFRALEMLVDDGRWNIEVEVSIPLTVHGEPIAFYGESAKLKYIGYSFNVNFSSLKFMNYYLTYKDYFKGKDINLIAHDKDSSETAVEIASFLRKAGFENEITISRPQQLDTVSVWQANKHGVTFVVEPSAVIYGDVKLSPEYAAFGKAAYEIYQFGTYVREGVKMIAGSYYPVNQSISPLEGIYKTSHSLCGNNLSPSHLVAMYTYLHDKERSYLNDVNLETGDEATFILLSKDVTNMNHNPVNDAKVLEVWYRGECIYHDNDRGTESCV